MLQTAIILAGGFGTRLQSVVSDLPKPLALVNGLPFLDYQLKYLKHCGIKKIILSVGYLAEKIEARYLSNFNGFEIHYAKENSPLGTGGAVRLSLEQSHDDKILVLNGDSFFDVDLQTFFNLSTVGKADFSLALRQVDNAERYGTIELNSHNQITSFKEKHVEAKAGLINGGVYLIDKNLYMAQTKANQNFSIEKDFFETQLNNFNILGFEFDNYFIDIGIPEDYNKAQNDFRTFKY